MCIIEVYGVHEQELPCVKSFSKGRIWELKKERGDVG
jgi:hypothetical protein